MSVEQADWLERMGVERPYSYVVEGQTDKTVIIRLKGTKAKRTIYKNFINEKF